MNSAVLTTQLEFAVSAMSFDFQTVIGVLVQIAIAGGCAWIAGYFSERIHGRISRALTTWPLYGLAFVLGFIVVVKILLSMLESVIPWLGSLMTSE
jgi:asparagine N-glycosylation enzyme membrane subunit Stt3